MGNGLDNMTLDELDALDLSSLGQPRFSAAGTLAAGSTRWGNILTKDKTTGAATDADSTPTVAVIRNGTADPVSVTVTRIATGQYRYSYSTAGWSNGDEVVEILRAVVGGTAGSRIKNYRIDATVSSRATPGDVTGAGIGNGDTPVDHNTPTADALRLTTSGGAGVDNVTLTAYLKADYDAGTRTLRGTTHTGPDGRWVNPLMLNAGQNYYLVADKQGAYQSKLITLTASGGTWVVS